MLSTQTTTVKVQNVKSFWKVTSSNSSPWSPNPDPEATRPSVLFLIRFLILPGTQQRLMHGGKKKNLLVLVTKKVLEKGNVITITEI